MKKIFSIIALMALVAGFAACDNEVDDYDININPVTPDSIAKGVYEGTWTRMLLADSSVVEGEGRIVIESDTAYIVKLSFISEDFNLNKSAVANITYANGGYYYFNHATSNELKTKFTGVINADGLHTTSFIITQMENRRVKKFQYTFEGRKIGNGRTPADEEVESEE